ncbi:MAG: DUF2752 domain-containing protein [Lachnospiraceae bacterium]|nr:DUF2752 domain-containing protein [Lachnospiraceae bacterium]
MRKIKNATKFLFKDQDIQVVMIIAALYIVLHILDIGCPIKFITGISCAGCGMTRAWLSVLKLNFSEAFTFHPLYWIIPLVGIFLFCRKRIPRVAASFITGSLIVLFVTVYIIRMINPEDTVVKIDFYESAIWYIIERVRELL